jgi:diguanylate cyclase (GGDEF)-like protein/PAS domain S-box-containing protein
MELFPISNEYDELQQLFQSGDFMLFKWQNIDTWQVESVSINIRGILGYSASEFNGGKISFIELLHPDDASRVKDELKNIAIEKQNNCLHKPYRLHMKDGGYMWVHGSTKIVRNSFGEISHFIGYITDITFHKECEKKHDLYSSIFLHTSEGILITDAQRNITSVNPAFQKITKYPDEVIIGKNPKVLSSGRHNKVFYDEMWEALNNKGEWQGKIWNKCYNGLEYVSWTTINVVYNKHGAVQHYVAFFSDITDITKAHEKILHQSTHDILTGLPNRLLFQDRIEQAIIHATRYKTKFALLFLDLDNFKNINDSLGHKVGDMLLQKIASRLIEVIRKEDTVCRQGGDEFLILVNDIKEANYLQKVIRKILKTINSVFGINNESIFTSFSVGVSIYPDNGESFDSLFQHADIAMYQAKNGGKNTYNFFDSKMDEKVQRNHLLQSQLSTAIKHNELYLVYQPQYDVKENKILGIEALLRWKSPGLGQVPPLEFIPIAEEYGMIQEIGEFVTTQSCKMLKKLNEKGIKNLVLAINISALQFHQSSFVQSLADIVSEIGIKTTDIELELTESILIEDTEKSIKTIEELKKFGFRLSIDDFGTGYSSLSYLKRFPADTLKIDCSFINNIMHDMSDLHIIDAIIGLGKAFGMDVIAEGIESEKQLELLKNHKCHIAQGYYLCIPLDEKELVQHVVQHGKDLIT